MQRTTVPNSATGRAPSLLAAAAAGHARGACCRVPAWHVWQRRIWCGQRRFLFSCIFVLLKLCGSSMDLLFMLEPSMNNKSQ